MALTELQRRVCRVIAATRIASGESYVAGGSALNEALKQPRISRDLDLFHDREEALAYAWDADRKALADAAFMLTVLRERPTFVEAEVREGESSVLLQWVVDSAYRFFPLQSHPDLGLVLHPFDLATNKVLALVGRMEVRDWVDTIATSHVLSPLGLLVWAAAGKDPGLGPSMILAEARRSTRYLALDLATLDFDGPTPTAGDLARDFRSMLAEAEAILALLPADQVGRAVLRANGTPFRGSVAELSTAHTQGQLVFHEGRLRGAFPSIRHR